MAQLKESRKLSNEETHLTHHMLDEEMERSILQHCFKSNEAVFASTSDCQINIDDLHCLEWTNDKGILVLMITDSLCSDIPQHILQQVDEIDQENLALLYLSKPLIDFEKNSSTPKRTTEKMKKKVSKNHDAISDSHEPSWLQRIINNIWKFFH